MASNGKSSIIHSCQKGASSQRKGFAYHWERWANEKKAFSGKPDGLVLIFIPWPKSSDRELRTPHSQAAQPLGMLPGAQTPPFQLIRRGGGWMSFFSGATSLPHTISIDVGDVAWIVG
jgi:hypothetical protein